MGWLSRAEVLILAVMLVDTAVIVCQCLYRYRMAARQSRAFVRDAAAGLQDANFDKVIRIASRNTYSHVASILAAGLTAFLCSPPSLTRREAIETSERAMHRAQKMTAAELNVGLGTLATIASSAPFIGLLGTCFGIIGAFRGYGMEKWAAVAMVMSFLSEALITTVMGLLVAVPALWCHNYLRNRMYGIESEMTNAALETLTYLESRSNFRDRVERWATTDTSLGSGVRCGLPLRYSEAPYDRQRVLLVSIGCGALCLACILITGLYRSYRWRASYDPTKLEYIPGQELVSPDHCHRAVVPPIYRKAANSPRNYRSRNVSCEPNPTAVTNVPNHCLRGSRTRAAKKQKTRAKPATLSSYPAATSP